MVVNDNAALRTTKVYLATAHLDHDPSNSPSRNLKALCQRCHMIHDRTEHQRRRRITLLMRKAICSWAFITIDKGDRTNARPQDIAHPQELIGSRVIIQGASGAGKTYAIRRILEATHGRMQHIVFDVEDELFTLRERFDYMLIGDDGADAPLSDPTSK